MLFRMEFIYSLSAYSEYSDWALLFLRLVLGVIFLAHGVPKLRNLKSTGEWMGQSGFRPGWLWAPVVAIAESCGGLALILGFGTPLVALALGIQFAVINFWKIFREEPLVGGFELDLAILAGLLVLLTVGGGAWGFGL